MVPPVLRAVLPRRIAHVSTLQHHTQPTARSAGGTHFLGKWMPGLYNGRRSGCQMCEPNSFATMHPVPQLLGSWAEQRKGCNLIAASQWFAVACCPVFDRAWANSPPTGPLTLPAATSTPSAAAAATAAAPCIAVAVAVAVAAVSVSMLAGTPTATAFTCSNWARRACMAVWLLQEEGTASREWACAPACAHIHSFEATQTQPAGPASSSNRQARFECPQGAVATQLGAAVGVEERQTSSSSRLTWVITPTLVPACGQLGNRVDRGRCSKRLG